MKFGFVAKHRGAWPVNLMCEALGVSRGGFYAWLTRPRSQRSLSDEVLGAQVHQSFVRSDRTYGARRVWHDVLEQGQACGLHRIERLMREQALRARPRRRGLPKDRGTRSAVADNVLDRQFRADGPNQKWVADFTYIWTAEGWLYVAAVLDLYSRRIVGWSMQESMTSQLVVDALMMAVWRRGKPVALLHHSDQGSQGGFNRSSQHPNHGGVYGTTRRVDAEVDRTRSDAFARRAVASARSGATVLEADCHWNNKREGSRGRWRLPASGYALVPSSWRHAIVHVEAGVSKISVIWRTRRDRPPAGTRCWCAGDSPPLGAQPINRFAGADPQRCHARRQARLPGIRCAVEG